MQDCGLLLVYNNESALSRQIGGWAYGQSTIADTPIPSLRFVNLVNLAKHSPGRSSLAPKREDQTSEVMPFQSRHRSLVLLPSFGHFKPNRIRAGDSSFVIFPARLVEGQFRARSLSSCRGCWSIRGYSLASLHFIRTASSRRMKPGGLPCLERTSSQSPVDPTTLTLLPFPMLPTFREEADGSSKTDVLRTV